jgi:hypothetical protein
MLGGVASFSPGKRMKIRLASVGKLEDDVQRRFCKFQKQNRELSFASVRYDKPVVSR